MDREKNTIILSGLLHDIGKLMNRIEGYQKAHPLLSGEFVSKHENIFERYVDIKLLKTLCERHHENFHNKNCSVEEISDDRIRALAYIISRADNYSSSERPDVDEETKTSEYQKTRLLSIFSKVDLGRDKIEKKLYYNLGSIYEDFNPVEEISYLKTYRELYNKLNEEIENVSSFNFNILLSKLISIFEKYLWCIPSDPRTEEQDISLFDHLYTTSAIGTCLYDYHKDKLDEREIKNDKKEKFILIGGDLSGIQKFIFEIERTNPKHLSKILRGRSFYLGLLTEAISLKILNTLNLPITCKIIDAAGRFIILAPKNESVLEKMKDLIKEIEIWFLKNFLGKLSLNLDYSVSLSGDDFSADRFVSKMEEVNEKIEYKKNQKFLSEYFIKREIDPFKDFYDKLLKNGECSFCGIFPKKDKENELCEICETSKRIGERITKNNIIIFGEPKKFPINICDIGVDITDSVKEDIYFYKELNELYNYFPVFNEKDISKMDNENILNLRKMHKKEENKRGYSLCYFCKDLCEQPEREEHLKNESILTFQCIANSSLRNNNGSGVDHLGILKADVDYLGLIFGKGVKNLTISRFSSLSRMLNFFFEYVLRKLIKENYPYIYSCYAGGDDLLLIGSWEDIIEFTIDMEKEFRKYVGNNKNITISAGISLTKPKVSLGLGIKEAENNLEKSKGTKDKNSLTIFGTRVEWDKIDEIKEFKNILDKGLKENVFKISFLYRLLKYKEMFDRSEKGEIEGLIFHSLMSYDVRRNIKKDEEEEMEERKNILEKLETLYTTGDKFNKNLMRNLKIPVFWTIYKNRGG